MSSRFSAVRALMRVGMAGTVLSASACRSVTEPAERVYTLDVAPARVPCTGSGPQQCLQVRERADAPYTRFYDTIDGFAYEPGYRYLLQVGARPVAHPLADGSRTAYRLVAVLSKTAATP